MTDDRPQLHVDHDFNPDEVRMFYEIPDALAAEIRTAAGDESLTLVESIALTLSKERPS